MGIWLHFVTFIGVAFVLSCEAKSPRQPASDDSTGDNDDGDYDNYPICGINEVYDICPRLCPPRRCDVDERIIQCAKNPNPGDPKCKPGCRCADNYYRNNDGNCVTKDECPKCFQKNEVYACRSSDPQTCETIDEEYEPIKKNKHCKRECRCKEGFYRNKIDECISRKNCLKCNGPNEYFTCGSACDNVCHSIHLQNQTNCPIENIKCNPKCYCEYGYARDHNNICVPIAECPPTCGVNEVYDICPALCPPRSCDVDDRTTDCAPNPEPGDLECNPGCRCEDNYYRNDLGVCVTRDECPTCGFHEVFDECPPTCPPQRCDVDNRLIKCRRTPMPGDPECKPGCRCEDNYYRNSLEECVRREECPPLIECGENEHPSSCANGGCRKVSCARPQIRCVKLKEGDCEEGCLCNDNYLRAENGTCIPEEDCPPVCGVNEVYDICPPICPQQRCDVDPSLILCKPNPKSGDPECNPGCRCANNFLKNNKGVCVPRDECHNEGNGKWWFDNKTETSIASIDCELNEEYSTCANGGCRRFNCNMTGILCVDLREGGCRPGCICKDTYTRSDDGICIPESQCPKLCGPNEEYGCDKTCTKTCKTVDGKCVPPIKSKICKLQCHCKDGYKRNKKGVCVTGTKWRRKWRRS